MTVTAYLILTHQAATSVRRLIERILASSPSAHVFVCHDDRAHPAVTTTSPRVHVRTHGHSSDWGSWDLVEATLDGFAWVREVVDPELTVLISGQCYPTRPLAAWESQFLRSGGGWVGTAQPLVYRSFWGRRLGEGDDDLTRYTYRWWQVPLPLVKRLSPRGHKAVCGIALRLAPLFGVRYVNRGRGMHLGIRRPSTPFTRRLVCCFGSQWLAIDRRLTAVVLRELAPGTALRRLYQTSVIPDESAIQTVLRSVEPPLADYPVSHSQWLVDEDRPRTWTLGDLEEVLDSPSPFCRKLDAIDSRGLMDALDQVNVATRAR